MSGIYKIVADDGLGNKVEVEMSREKLCQFIGDSILLGVHASQKIEGEEVNDSDLDLLVINDLPENLLVIP